MGVSMGLLLSPVLTSVVFGRFDGLPPLTAYVCSTRLSVDESGSGLYSVNDFVFVGEPPYSRIVGTPLFFTLRVRTVFEGAIYEVRWKESDETKKIYTYLFPRP